MDFALSRATVFLETFKPDMKKDANSVKRPVCYLRLKTQQPSEILRAFAPDLEGRYYDLDADGVDIAGGKPLLDSHQVFPHKRTESMSGATARIDYGAGKMDFADAGADDFALHPMPGSIVVMSFTLALWADQVQAGWFYMLQEQEFTLTLDPPSDRQGSLRVAA